LILRGVSIEVGGHINDRMWQGYWDFVFVFANFLLSILFGAAAGNVARGVPLDEHGDFAMAFFTNFGVRGEVGLLDWYTVSVAVFAVVVLAAHGATYLALKTEGPVHDRSEAYARDLWMMAGPLFLVVSVESGWFVPSSDGLWPIRCAGWERSSFSSDSQCLSRASPSTRNGAHSSARIFSSEARWPLAARRSSR